MREFELLHRIYAANRHLRAPGPGAGTVIVPPGDDLALLRLPGSDVLVGVDQVVDGRHVDLARVSLEDAGRKALRRALSDVAAMAGRPAASLATAALPPDLDEARAAALFEAMRIDAQALGAPLVGGDIALLPPGAPLVLGVTVLAVPGPAGAITRDGARAGDLVATTGRLGGAWRADGGGRHLRPEPRIACALALAERLGDALHALIDLSDGLGRDAAHVGAASGHRIEIDLARVPCAENCDWRRAVGDGEDYELLLAFAADRRAEVEALSTPELPITIVGRVADAPGPPWCVGRIDGATHALDEMGWQHAS